MYLLITNYAPCVSSSHHSEEPGPNVLDDLLAGMKGLLLGPPEPSFLQAEATQLLQLPLTGPVLQPPDDPSAGLASSLCLSWIKDPKPDTVF